MEGQVSLSGIRYNSGMTVKYLMLPFAVFCILCAIGSGIAGGLTYSIWFLVIAVVCLVTRSYGMKMMRVIIYWGQWYGIL